MDPLPRRPLADFTVPPVVFGAMDRRTPERDEARLAVLEAAVDAGLDVIDTAPLYEFGRSEALLGKLLSRKPAGSVKVLTKVGLRWDDDHGDLLFQTPDGRRVRRDGRPEAVRKDVEASLRRLGVERLDLVQVHHLDRHVPLADTLGALEDLRRAGKVRAIGVSNVTPTERDESRRCLAGSLATVQNEHHLLARDPIAEDAHALEAFLAYSPLGGGLLARPRTSRPTDWRGGAPVFHPRNLRRVARALDQVVAPIARRRGATVAEVVIAWCHADPGVTAAIVGPGTEAQVASAVRAARLALSVDERSTLDTHFRAVRLDALAGAPLRRRVTWLVRGLGRRLRHYVPGTQGRGTNS